MRAALLLLPLLLAACKATKPAASRNWHRSHVDEIAVWRLENHHLFQLCTHNSRTVAVLSIANDSASWDRAAGFQGYLDMVASFDYPKHCLSLGILVSDADEASAVLTELERHANDYARLTVVHTPAKAVTTLDNRKLDALQGTRRRQLAALRNTLVHLAVWTEDYALWIDADIVAVPPGTLAKAVRSGKDIVAARCNWDHQGPDGQEYDQNTWVGKRLRPTAEELDAIRRQRNEDVALEDANHENHKSASVWVPRHGNGTRFLRDFRDDPAEFVGLDSVGGTWLLIRAAVFRSGVAFSPTYAVGTDWDILEGWDGIETESLCYQAAPLGFRCWGMPHEVVLHGAW